jgi:arylsulfatase A-like enzyme
VASRPTLRGPAAAALLGVLLAACGGGEEVRRPNVLLISVDTLRPDFLGHYGHDRPTSPVLDRIAAEGTVFDDVTSASPWTLPSHASMLTGLYPSSHGVKNHDRQLTKETLATRLRKAGYQTLAVVNSHNIGDKRFGLLRGFESSFYESEMDLAPETALVAPEEKLIGNKGDKITKRALRMLKERDPERPFFLFLHYYDVHTDFTPDAKWRMEFVSPYAGELTGHTQQLIKYRLREDDLTPEDVRWLEEMYEAEIRTLDEILERIFDYLDVAGLAQDTLVVLTSDHGEEYWEHEGVLHGRTYYQEVIRIPILMRGPGVPAGRRVATPVHLIDVPATIYSLVAVHPTETLDGIDLTRLWAEGAEAPEPRYLFAEADHNNIVDGEDVVDIGRMIRIGDEKLCYDTITGRKELYDLATDPGELNDLSEERPERVAELFAELQRFMERETASGARELEPLDEEMLQDLNRLGY